MSLSFPYIFPTDEQLRYFLQWNVRGMSLKSVYEGLQKNLKRHKSLKLSETLCKTCELREEVF